jgi:hypothetical protein
VPAGFAHAVALTAGDHGVAVVQQLVQQADGGGVLGQEPAPVLERVVAADAEGLALVGRGDEPEQQLGAGVVQGREAELVDEDEVVAEQRVDDPSDAVVREAAVEGLDEVGGAEVADLVPAPMKGWTAATPTPTSRWHLPVPAFPMRQTFSAARTNSRLAR